MVSIPSLSVVLSEVVQPKVKAVIAKAVAQKVIKFFFIASSVCYICFCKLDLDSTIYLRKGIDNVSEDIGSYQRHLKRVVTEFSLNLVKYSPGRCAK